MTFSPSGGNLVKFFGAWWGESEKLLGCCLLGGIMICIRGEYIVSYLQPNQMIKLKKDTSVCSHLLNTIHLRLKISVCFFIMEIVLAYGARTYFWWWDEPFLNRNVELAPLHFLAIFLNIEVSDYIYYLIICLSIYLW